MDYDAPEMPRALLYMMYIPDDVQILEDLLPLTMAWPVAVRAVLCQGSRAR